MASVGETKKMVSGVAGQLDGLGRSLESSESKFESARAQAEQVVRGSSSDVEARLVGKLKQATDSAQTARAAIKRAVEACTRYADQKL